MEDKFLELIKEVLEIEDREPAMGDNFKEYDEWDSLARLSLIASIDDEYNVQIEEEKFRTLNTLSELYTEIQNRAEA